MDQIKTLAELNLCYIEEMMESAKYGNDPYPYDEKYYMKILGNSIIRYIGIKSKINFRYGLTQSKQIKEITICLICNKEFKDIEICRTPSCKHLFHATCICSLENKETKELKCPICEQLI